MQSSLPDRDVILWGIGHTNAHVLRMWRMRPIANARLTCVSDRPVATYSGMLPGVLAGHFPREKMEIDLVRLCASAGARLIVAEPSGLDIPARELLFADRPPMPFDALSIGIGSIPAQSDLHGIGSHAVSIKPMQTFLGRLRDRLIALEANLTCRPIRLAVVGGGAGGVEITLCLPGFVRRVLGNANVELVLIQGQPEIHAGSLARTNERARRKLESRGVRILLGRRVQEVGLGYAALDDGESIEADVVVWVTGAAAPPILSQLGLPTDDRGFLLTRPNLRTIADAPIFVVGDSGTIQGDPIPKAGVHAVREAPILWRNLGHLLAGRGLEPFRPQRDFLKLLNTGDGRAIGEYAGFSFEGKWCRWLKDYIDTKFIEKYQRYSPMPANLAASVGPVPMRCAGCGGKVGGAVLRRVLSKLDVKAGDGVLVGLDAPDDAAIVRPPPGRPLALTVDFFEAPLADPYLVGRIAALHAASDAWAMNARPLWALATATIPVGRPRQQEQLLHELLAGSLRELDRMGASLVGGHTIEGPSISVGFTIVALPGEGPLRAKSGFREGDQLVLTKAIGSGILLAAHMRALTRAGWMTKLVETMLVSNQEAASLIEVMDLPGATDVTGFGLAGHLLEILAASRLDADLDLDAVPLLPGAIELIEAGVESTLAPANRAAEAAIEASPGLRRSPRYAALFDPQTCGGLLLGIPPDRVSEALERIGGEAAIIGRLRPPEGEVPRIHVR